MAETKNKRIPMTPTDETAILEVKPNQKNDRKYVKDGMTFDHDLFILEPAVIRKNHSYTKDPYYKPHLHKHVFHSNDSDGKRQTHSSAMAGHFHEMIVTPDPDGGFPNVKCGPAYEWTTKKTSQGIVRVAIPVDQEDSHVHEVTYDGSQRIQIRKLNVEAAKVQAADAEKTKVPPGIVG